MPRVHTTESHRRRCPGRRTLVLVDAENLLGTSRFAPYSSAAVMALAVTDALGLQPGDQVIVGCDVTIAHPVGCAFPGRHLVVGHGKNGADRALLQAVEDLAFIVSRFGRVVVGSGDHAFAPLAGALARAGVEVCVLSRKESISRELAAAATCTVPFPPCPMPTAA